MTKHRDRNARLDALIPCAPIPNFAFRIILIVPPRAPTPVPELKPAGTNAAPANNLYTHNNTQPHCGRRNSADKRPR